jgi:uncharacterized protein (DUF1778 family)
MSSRKSRKSNSTLERLETRVSPEDRARIIAASKAANESVAHLLHRSALKEADEILGREVDVTRMPTLEYEALLVALDGTAEPIPQLEKIASRSRSYVKH